MRPMLRRLALVAGAAVTLSATAAAAQQPPMPPMPPRPPMEMREHHDPAAHAQRLRDVLQLRSDQEPALQAYLAASAPKPRTERMKADDGPKGPLTTPQRLDREAERMAKMADHFRERADATKAFYAALSPSQQKALDALGPALGGPGMRMRRIEIRHDGPGFGARGPMMQRKVG
jgi:hypothetical protein